MFTITTGDARRRRKERHVANFDLLFFQRSSLQSSCEEGKERGSGNSAAIDETEYEEGERKKENPNGKK